MNELHRAHTYSSCDENDASGLNTYCLPPLWSSFATMGRIMQQSSALDVLERVLLFSTFSGSPSVTTPLASDSSEDRASSALVSEIEIVVENIRRGNYSVAFSSASARGLLCSPLTQESSSPDPSAADYYDTLQDVVDQYLTGLVSGPESQGEEKKHGMIDGSEEERRLLVLALGVAALHMFVQANVTGPEADVAACPAHLAGVVPGTPVALGAGEGGPAGGSRRDAERHPWDRWARKKLMVDGADSVGKYALPQYLVLANMLLVDPVVAAPQPATSASGPSSATSATPTPEEGHVNATRGRAAALLRPGGATPRTATWWAMRALLAHQRVLAERSPTLRARLVAVTRETLARFSPPLSPALEGGAWGGQWAARDVATLAAAVELEAGLMEHAYSYSDAARARFEQAAGALSLSFRVTGAMGYRTIHQVDPKAQMVLEITSTAPIAASRNRQHNGGGGGGNDNEGEAEEEELISETEEEAAAAAAAAAAAQAAPHEGEEGEGESVAAEGRT
eukprot:jgi/Mesen1/10288/ME000079S09711